jgi:uncharacterized damage-inducible protein DinB
MPYSILTHLNYNIWATAKLSEILENVDESIIKNETPSSFNSIEKTILHIWDSQLIWSQRMQGESLTEWPSKSFIGDQEELISGWIDNCVALKDYVESKGDDYLQTVIEYKTLEGKAYSNTVEEIIYHVVNHGTFHRGQIITMLRANGLKELGVNGQSTSTDLITYLRAVTT